MRLPAEFARQFAGREMESAAILEKFDETFSNAVQLAPRKGLLARDPDAEIDRLFREQVEPLRETRRGAAEIRTRSDVRARAADYFRTEKILRLMQRGVRVEEFTAPGRSHAHRFFLPPQRHARLRAFRGPRPRPRAGQAPRLHRRAPSANTCSTRNFWPSPNASPRAATCGTISFPDILRESEIRVVPLGELRKWAHDVAPVLRAEADVTGD